jgi:hypothetical protein
MRRVQRAAIGADRDAWTRRAFNDALVDVKGLISGNLPPINPSLKLERLTDSEWGWFTSTAIGSWVRVRAEQATIEGLDIERMIRATGLEPDPRDAGAVVAILPQLLEACPELDWSKSVGEWAKDDIIAFLIAAYGLIRRAFAARDAVEARFDAKPHPGQIGRELNAAAGNPLMTIDELRGLGESLG